MICRGLKIANFSLRRILYVCGFCVFLVALSGCQTPGNHQVASSITQGAATGHPIPEIKPEPAPPRPDAPNITAKAAILVDHRGRVLFEKNADVRLPTASTQKLLVGILVADRGNLDQYVTVASSDTACEPTVMGIKPGQSYRRGDLLHAMLIRSSNDIARCLARDHSGSVSGFAHNMNIKARQLGMNNSYFTNASGLPTPSGQYSTARDLAILGFAAMQRPVIREAVNTKATTFYFSDGSSKPVYNTNQVLKANPYCNGCKTGYTREAGRCLVSSASNGRKNVIAVILGSKTPEVWSESDALLRYGLGF